MLTQLDAFGVDKPSGPHLTVYLRRMLAQEVAVVAFDEAHLHALALVGLQRIALVTQVFAYLQLGVGAQREDAPAQYVLPQAPEKI